MSDFRERLEKFLRESGQPLEIEQLTPDASVREYFRVSWNGAPAIACVYPEIFVAREHSYIEVTNLFLVSGLPVAKIYDYSERLGTIILEDFGDTILREHLSDCAPTERERLLDGAIMLIARIQAATDKAFEMNSIASRLKFDEEKLLWELNFFKEHYFTSLKKAPLSAADETGLTAEFTEIAQELETRAAVLCHRDFHAANLMIDNTGELLIIDHQDARIGSAAYDLASLLLDRVLEIPDENWLNEKKTFFLRERENFGLEKLDREEFAREFELQAIQRCLKAAGTFSYQSTFRAKAYFVPFIKPMFRIALQAAATLDRFPVLQRIMRAEIDG